MNNGNTKIGGAASGAAFAFMMIFYLAAAFIGQAVLFAVAEEGSFVFYAINSLFSVFSISVTLIIASKLCKAKFSGMCAVNKFNPFYIFFAVALAAGMFFGLGFINIAVAEGLDKIGINVPENNIPLNETWQYLVMVLLLAVFPAVAEEFFFRGAIAGGVGGTGVFVAAAVNALCFSLYHCSLSQFFYQFIYGFALFILMRSASSVLPAVIAHFFNNFAVLTFTYFGVEVNLYNPLIIAGGLVLLSVCVVFFVFYYVKKGRVVLYVPTESKDKNLCRKDGVSKENAGEIKAFFFPYGILGVVVCVAMIVAGAFA